MLSHELAGPYQAKAAEYLIAVLYLLLFVPFWRFVNGGRSAAAVAPARSVANRSWFSGPPWLRFHPGHSWVGAAADDGVVTVGLDDFARKLVGPLTAVRLPAPGSTVAQGEKAWTLLAGSRGVDMLSPLDGTVVAVNPAMAESPAVPDHDPYGDGWLLKIKPSRWEANAKQLLSGGVARKWMEGVAEAVQARTRPGLGVLLQDGGSPVNGIAQELDPERWDEVARTFLLS